MSASDIEVAILNIKLATTVSPAAAAASPVWSFVQPDSPLPITFFKPPLNQNVLHASAVGQSVIGTLVPSVWSPISGFNYSSLFYWDAQQNIKWNTVSSEDKSLTSVTVFTSGAIVSASSQTPIISTQIVVSTPSPTPITPTTPTTPMSLSVPGVTTGIPIQASTSAAAPVPQTPKPSANSKNRLSSGTIVGAAVGSFIAGVAVAGLILWFCMRKKRPSRAQDYEASSTALISQEKGFHASAIPLASGISAASPTSIALPLPLEDNAIAGEVSKISNSIKNHVQSYYHMSRVSPGLIDLDDIQAIGNHQPISAGTLSTLLGNAATREIALRFCIAWAICWRTSYEHNLKESLLPVEVIECYERFASEHNEPSTHLTTRLAHWRVTTAELTQKSFVQDAFTNSDSRTGRIQATFAALDNILRPFADSRIDNGDRERNLKEILKRSAGFAFTLFSQPSTWGFDWAEEGIARSGELTIFPALLQLKDETGQRITPPRPFSEAVVRRLTE